MGHCAGLSGGQAPSVRPPPPTPTGPAPQPRPGLREGLGPLWSEERESGWPLPRVPRVVKLKCKFGWGAKGTCKERWVAVNLTHHALCHLWPPEDSRGGRGPGPKWPWAPAQGTHTPPAGPDTRKGRGTCLQAGDWQEARSGPQHRAWISLHLGRAGGRGAEVSSMGPPEVPHPFSEGIRSFWRAGTCLAQQEGGLEG